MRIDVQFIGIIIVNSVTAVFSRKIWVVRRDWNREGGDMGMLRKLFGKGSDSSEAAAGSSAESVEHEGYVIQPAPRKEKGSFHTAGYIRKCDESGQWQEQFFIRADTHADFKTACDHSVFKGRQIIDEYGGRNLFRD